MYLGTVIFGTMSMNSNDLMRQSKGVGCHVDHLNCASDNYNAFMCLYFLIEHDEKYYRLALLGYSRKVAREYIVRRNGKEKFMENLSLIHI